MSLLCRRAVVLFVVLPAASGLALQVALHVKSSSGAGPIGDMNVRRRSGARPPPGSGFYWKFKKGKAF